MRLFIAEQLGFEQVFRDGRAVDRDEAAAATAARLVETAREQLLARAGRAEQHHRHVGIGDPLDRPRDLQHLGRGGDHRAEHGAFVAHLLFEARFSFSMPWSWKARRTISPSWSMSTGFW
jgi:hypothetical protein